jgi:hypothetical protein
MPDERADAVKRQRAACSERALRDGQDGGDEREHGARSPPTALSKRILLNEHGREQPPDLTASESV